MWMSELARRSGLPVATIKFYLREGLLHPGEATAATRAAYDESHLRRLRLVRALVEVADLRLDAVRQVLTAVEDRTLPMHQVVGAAHTQLSRTTSGTGASAESLARVDELLARRGWRVAESSAHRQALARALDGLRSVDHEVSDELLEVYAAAMADVAGREVAAALGSDREDAVERAVVGTLLLEPVLLAVRRLAQEDASARRPA
jgi:DNA-binding transcriptional MerR regulator